jgi:hypothetical protein
VQLTASADRRGVRKLKWTMPGASCEYNPAVAGLRKSAGVATQDESDTQGSASSASWHAEFVTNSTSND